MPLHRIGDKIVLFVHIPKTGGSTIEAWLNDLGPRALKYPGKYEGLLVAPQHFHADLLEKIIPNDFYEDAFCIVRDPFERLMSEYRWVFRRKMPLSKRLWLQSAKSHEVDLSWHFAKWVRKQLSRTDKDPLTRDNHIRPQSDFLGVEKCRVYRFEDGFDTIMADLAKRWNVPGPGHVPHENATNKRPLQVGDKTRKLIDTFYAQDFERLGYPLATDRN